MRLPYIFKNKLMAYEHFLQASVSTLAVMHRYEQPEGVR